MKKRAEPHSKPAVRERIAEDAEGMYDDISAFFKEALGAERKLWMTCQHCDRRSEVEVPDWNARAKVLETLLNQGYGRPRSEEDTAGHGFILKRIIVVPGGAESEPPSAA